MAAQLSEADLMLANFRRDFQFYAPRALKIRTKKGAIAPLTLNRAQMYVHQRLEQQYERTRKVRAYILKGRQQGMSTYVGGRYYWRASGEIGKRVYILTHRADATANLFGMVKRYHDYCPAPIKPSTGRSNLDELVFDKLDSSYYVATAGAQGTGRSATAQFFHGSEMAFWRDPAEHLAGLGQVIPDMEGTEMIFESTGNGMANEFYNRWEDAKRGRSEYEPIFVPWMWQEEYTRPVPPEFELEDDEVEYMNGYGCTLEQMAWRRNKINSDLRGDVSLFDQEYPAIDALAFMRVVGQVLLRPAWVARAKVPKPDLVDSGPFILGVDPADGDEEAYNGEDDTAVSLRRGRRVHYTQRRHNLDPRQAANWVAKLVDDCERKFGERPAAINVDGTGVGSGCYANLKDMGLPVNKVMAGERAYDDEQYARVGDEMWGNMRDWMLDTPVEIPDDPVLVGELISRTFDWDANQRVVLTSKKVMRKAGAKSPDSADSVALTFAVRLSGSLGGGKVDHARRSNMRLP